MSHNRAITGNVFGDGAQVHQGDVIYHGPVHNSNTNTDSECLRDLYMTDPRLDKVRIEQAKGGLLRVSYSWILEHSDFTSWLHDPDKRLLWIRGDPGKGKTMLLCGIIDELQTSQTSVLRPVFHFCQATDVRLNSATAVLRGLIYFLATLEPTLIAHIREKYDSVGKKIFEDQNAWFALVDIFMVMLRESSVECPVVILDAVDECVTDQDKLLELICTSASSSRTKWIVSSRMSPSINEGLSSVNRDLSVNIRLEGTEVSSAIGAYIDHQVNQLAESKNYDASLKLSVRDRLEQNACGTFLWVSLVCKELALPRVKARHVPGKLKQFPSGLNALYDRMLDQASNDQRYWPFALTLLEIGAFVHSKCLEEDDVDGLRDIIEGCGSLLFIQENAVYFVHQSAKDYILENAGGRILTQSLGHQHLQLVHESINIMKRRLRRDVHGLQQPGIHIDDVSAPGSDPLSGAGYACVYWIDHLINPETILDRDKDLSDDGCVLGFFKVCHLYWLEALSLLRSIPTGVQALQRVMEYCKRHSQLRAFVEDAYRHIIYFGKTITNSPLQIYTSCLAFSPSTSIIRRSFEEQLSQSMTLRPKVESHWGPRHLILEHDKADITTMLFSSADQVLASASEDGTIRIWDLTTGLCKKTFNNHSTVKAMAFSGDGCQLVSCSQQLGIKIWNLTTDECVQEFPGLEELDSEELECDQPLFVSLENQRLVYATKHGVVSTRDVVTGTRVGRLHTATILERAATFAKNRQIAVMPHESDQIVLWNLETEIPVYVHCGLGTLQDFRILPGGTSIVVSSHLGQVVIDATTGQILRRYQLERFRIHMPSRVLSINDRMLMVCHANFIELWDAEQGECSNEQACGEILDHHVSVSEDGRQLASHLYRRLHVWDIEPHVDLSDNALFGTHIVDMSLTRDGECLATTLDMGTARLWNTNTNECIWVTPDEDHAEGNTSCPRPFVQLIILSDNSRRLISWTWAGFDTVAIWDIPSSSILKTINNLHLFAQSSDGNYSAWCYQYSHELNVWNSDRGCRTMEFQGISSIAAIAFSANGRLLAVLTRTERETPDALYDLDEIDSSNELYALQELYSIYIWDLALKNTPRTSGNNEEGYWPQSSFTKLMKLCYLERICRSELHQFTIFDLSSDRQTLAWANKEVVEVWDAKTGRSLRVIEFPLPVRQLEFTSDDGSRLLTNFGEILVNELPDVKFVGYGISMDLKWIMKGEARELRIPLLYRPRKVEVRGNLIVILSENGLVFSMRFR